MQLCSHRYVRITGLLSTPLVLRIGDWLYVLPAITRVVDKSMKVKKAASSDLLVVNRWCIQSTVFHAFDTSDLRNMSKITLYTLLHKSNKHHFRHLQHT